ncbi:MFS transporter [Actinomadura rupiterrae]|uniref:MFS transporter n=1 Tax=Actinomadura rupiterrae TaxID=559627 RepID=UPI0020A5A1B9|nr:MFS transporter [Actinomadura rupiterrae]MCP2341908.1 MFS family permease [Actinomadura rupiterrae]
MPGSDRRARTLWVVCGSLLLIPVTATGAAEATADVGRSLHAGLAASQWVVNAFFLTFASFMAGTGSLADRIGRRRMFGLGLAVFTASMLVATLAPDIGTLVAARLLAGAGAAAATTGGSALLAAAFPDGPARARAFGVFGTVLGLGLAFGPVIAGTLVSGLGWRAFFGVAAVALLPSLAAVPLLSESRQAASGRLDLVGAVTFTLGLSAFTFALVEGPTLGWTHGTVRGGFAACVLLLAAFAVVERRHAAPLVDLALLARPRFVAISAMPFLLAFGFVALTIVLPPYFMATLHASAGRAGVLLMLLTGPTLLLPPLTGLLARRLSQRTLLVTTLLLVALGTALLALVPGGAGAGALAAPLLLIGSGFGISLAIMDGAAISSVEPDRAGMAAGVFNTARITGEVVAVAVLGALLTTLTRADLASRYGAGIASDATSRLLQGDMTPPRGTGGGPGYASAATHAYASALHDVLWALSALSLVGAVVVARLLRASDVPTRPLSSDVAAELAVAESVR